LVVSGTNLKIAVAKAFVERCASGIAVAQSVSGAGDGRVIRHGEH